MGKSIRIQRVYFYVNALRPNIKLNVFRITGLKFLGREDIHIYFNHFLGDFFMHFERQIRLSKRIKLFFPKKT